MARGTGATTKQMLAAKPGALFVWVNGRLDYPRSLARKHGREDLEIVNPHFLEDGRWQGREFSEIVVDHAARLSERQFHVLQLLGARIR